MSICLANKLNLSFFGEPASEYTGVIMEGVPAGVVLDTVALKTELSRAGRYESYIFPDRMQDTVLCRIAAGYAAGHTSGAPLAFFIKNEEKCSPEEEIVLRPSLGDLGAAIKYGESGDLAGGGYHSDFLLRAITVAGAVAKQLLLNAGIYIGSHFSSIGSIEDTSFLSSNLSVNEAEEISKKPLPIFSEELLPYIRRHIREHAESGDTVGGVIELFATPLPAGLGSPLAKSIQSIVAAELFALPSVTGVSFGEGFSLSSKTGKKVNDLPLLDGGRLRPDANHYGGVDGPYTNGQPLVVQASIAPSPLLGMLQNTVNLTTMSGDVIGKKSVEVNPFRLIAACEGAFALALYELRFGE